MTTVENTSGSGRPERPWTVGLYLAGDNDLAFHAQKDVEEMIKTGTNDNFYLGIEYDANSLFKGSRRYEVSKPRGEGGLANLIDLDRLDEGNSADPKRFGSFIQWFKDQFPQNKGQMVILWGHGKGFQFTHDYQLEDSGNLPTVFDIRKEFIKAGYSKRNRLDLLAFDSCLMNTLEVAHHFSDFTEYMVGSQYEVPPFGWPYKEVLEVLGHANDSESLGKDIAHTYMTDYRSRGMPNVTQSLLHVKRINPLISLLDEIGKKLLDGLDKNLMKDIRLRLLGFGYNYIDVNFFVGELNKRGILDETFNQKWQSAIQKVVIYSDAYGIRVEKAQGLSLWYPKKREAYLKQITNYRKLKGMKNHAWTRFLDKMYAEPSTQTS